MATASVIDFNDRSTDRCENLVLVREPSLFVYARENGKHFSEAPALIRNEKPDGLPLRRIYFS